MVSPQPPVAGGPTFEPDGTSEDPSWRSTMNASSSYIDVAWKSRTSAHSAVVERPAADRGRFQGIRCYRWP